MAAETRPPVASRAGFDRRPLPSAQAPTPHTAYHTINTDELRAQVANTDTIISIAQAAVTLEMSVCIPLQDNASLW